MIDEEDFDKQEIYAWIDEFNLSRPKRCINRDFSDGVLVAEILKVLYPRLVELHNYVPANSKSLKVNNWTTLNRKVLKKLNLQLTQDNITQIVDLAPGAIERFLMRVKQLADLSKLDEDKDYNSDSQSSIFLDSLDQRAENAVLHQQIQHYHKNEAHLNKQLLEKEDTIAKLKGKIKHLEEIVELKDQQIRDLTKCIKKEKLISF